MTNLEIIKKDDYLNEFIKKHNLSDDFLNAHINKFLEVLNSRNKCLNCKGLCTCLQKSKGERLDIKFEEVLLEEIEYCDYLKESKAIDKLVNSYVYSDVPETFNTIDINTIDLLDVYQKQLCAKLLNILNNNSKGLYISGDLGVGKTYECIGLANALVRKGEKVAFVKCASFINEMRKLVMNDAEAFNNYFNKIKTVKYLFLDDIGAESVSSFSRDDILFEILDYRMENKLCTVFTSNLSKENLVKHYTFDKNDNSNLIKARRLVERINVLSDDFVLEGNNKRG